MVDAIHAPSDGGRFVDLSGRAAVDQAVEEAGRSERVIAAALVLGGAWLLARSPLLRRLVWRGAREAIRTWLPLYLAREVSQAWRASTPPRREGEGR
jgi:hypothetical protein